MSDDLRAAAQRILNSPTLHMGTGPGVVCIRPDDAESLAIAYLADHPADEDTKLTIDEAEKEFGARGHIDATVSSHRSVVAVKIDDWILLETRGDLRTLLSILPPF